MARTFSKPKRVKTGQSIKAEHYNDLARAIEELQSQFTPVEKKRPRTATNAPPFWTTIAPIPDSAPVAYAATFTLGYFTYQSAPSADAADPYNPFVGYIVPTINGVAMDAPNPPVNPGDPVVEPLELPDVVSYIYLRIKTTAKGMPDFDITPSPVTIEAFDSSQESIHHVRLSPSSGEEAGDYFFLIAETESNGATTPAPRIKRRITGNRNLPNQLIEIKNIGGKRELYGGYSPGPEDNHEFRSLEQLVTANSADIIKPLGESAEEGDTIQFRNIRKNNSDSVPYSITASGDSVNLQLTGAEGTYTDLDGGEIEFTAGLAKSFNLSDLVPESFDIEIWGKNFTIDFTAETVTSEEGTSATAFLFVRKGRVYRSNPDDEPADPPLPVFKIYEASVST